MKKEYTEEEIQNVRKECKILMSDIEKQLYDNYSGIKIDYEESLDSLLWEFDNDGIYYFGSLYIDFDPPYSNFRFRSHKSKLGNRKKSKNREFQSDNIEEFLEFLSHHTNYNKKLIQNIKEKL